MDKMLMPDEDGSWLQRNLGVLLVGAIAVLGMVAIAAGIVLWVVS